MLNVFFFFIFRHKYNLRENLIFTGMFQIFLALKIVTVHINQVE